MAAPAVAQYRDAGNQLEPVQDRKKELEKLWQDAPWHLGGMKVAPWIGIRDINYVKELDAAGREQEGDLTATVGAGLRGYLRLGGHGMLATHVLPEYAWWQKQSERSAVVGRYGLGLFHWFNRLETELTARRTEDVGFLSPDLLLRAPIRSDEFTAKAQLRFLGSLALFVSGQGYRNRVELDTETSTPLDPAQLLDRDGQEVRAGLRYLLRSERGYIGAGALEERTKFQDVDESRSSKGSSWYAEANVHGNHADISVRYDQRDLEPDGSTFPGYHAPNGTASFVLHPGWRLSYQLYGRRELLYSAIITDSFLEEQRLGAGLNTSIGPGALQLFYEAGDDDYFGATSRHEDVTAWGGWYEMSVRKLNFRLGGRETEFQPDLGPVRKVNELLGSISMSFGPRGDW
jgi:hypothetical protein